MTSNYCSVVTHSVQYQDSHGIAQRNTFTTLEYFVFIYVNTLQPYLLRRVMDTSY